MTNKITAFGGTDWADGNVLYAADLIQTITLARTKIQEIYTGTGFDTSQGGTGTDTDDYELTAIVSADLAGFNYLAIEVNCVTTITMGAVAFRNASSVLTYQTKEIGGAYGNVFTATIKGNANQGDESTQTNSVNYIHTLTAGEKAAGVQVKIISVTTTVDASATLSNKQTVEKLMN